MAVYLLSSILPGENAIVFLSVSFCCITSHAKTQQHKIKHVLFPIVLYPAWIRLLVWASSAAAGESGMASLLDLGPYLTWWENLEGWNLFFHQEASSGLFVWEKRVLRIKRNGKLLSITLGGPTHRPVHRGKSWWARCKQ